MDQDITVNCMTSGGMFASEREVKVEYGGKLLWQGIVDKELVLGAREEIGKDKYIPARVAAYLVKATPGGTVALVEFPSEGWATGNRVQIPLDLIQKQKLPA